MKLVHMIFVKQVVATDYERRRYANVYVCIENVFHSLLLGKVGTKRARHEGCKDDMHNRRFELNSTNTHTHVHEPNTQ